MKKVQMKERAPSLYKWLMMAQENMTLSAPTLRAVALHIEALADLVEATTPKKEFIAEPKP